MPANRRVRDASAMVQLHALGNPGRMQSSLLRPDPVLLTRNGIPRNTVANTLEVSDNDCKHCKNVRHAAVKLIYCPEDSL
jgi:hypothetical protein